MIVVPNSSTNESSDQTSGETTEIPVPSPQPDDFTNTLSFGQIIGAAVCFVLGVLLLSGEICLCGPFMGLAGVPGIICFLPAPQEKSICSEIFQPHSLSNLAVIFLPIFARKHRFLTYHY